MVLLWFLRDRPLWFGAVLGIGVLNREFTIYAVPVLLAIQLLDGSLFRADRVRMWLVAGAVFLAVWQGVEALKPFADLMGPGTRGQLPHGETGSVVGNVMARTSIESAALLERSAAMLREYFPRQIGAVRIESSVMPHGRDWLLWPAGLVLTMAFARGLQLMWRRRTGRPATAFGWYLLGIGVLAAAGYMVTRGIHVAAAGYWRAYKLTFLSKERVQIASTDVTRISRYDRLAEQEGDRLLVLQPDPCRSDQPPIGGWYLCRAER